MDELDQIKDRDSTYGRRAGAVLRALDRVVGNEDWLAPRELRPNVWLQLLDEPPGHNRRSGQDDEIVRQAAYFAQLNEGREVLVTIDRGMRLRGQAAGLTGKALPENLKRIEKSDA